MENNQTIDTQNINPVEKAKLVKDFSYAVRKVVDSGEKKINELSIEEQLGYNCIDPDLIVNLPATENAAGLVFAQLFKNELLVKQSAEDKKPKWYRTSEENSFYKEFYKEELPPYVDVVINRIRQSEIVEIDEEEREKKVKEKARQLKKMATTQTRNAIIAQSEQRLCTVGARVEINDNAPANHFIIPLKNAFYDAKKDEMVTNANVEQFNAMKEEHKFTRFLPVEYDPTKKDAPYFDNLVSRLFDNDKRKIEEFMYSCVPAFLGVNTYQTITFIYGAGGTGKSTLLNCIQSLFWEQGMEESSFFGCWSPTMFEKKQGASHQEDLHSVRNARVVIGSEMIENNIDTQLLKTAVGDKQMTTSGKNGKQMTYHNGKTFIVGVNEIPHLKNDSGVERRIIVLEATNNPLKIEERDNLLNEKLEQEKSAIFNKFLPYIKEVMKNGGQYQYSDETLELSKKCVRGNDYFYEWFEDILEKLHRDSVYKIPVSVMESQQMLDDYIHCAKRDKGEHSPYAMLGLKKFKEKIKDAFATDKKWVREKKRINKNERMLINVADVIKVSLYDYNNVACYYNAEWEEEKQHRDEKDTQQLIKLARND